MAFVGTILQEVIKRNRFYRNKKLTAIQQQEKVLKKLLETAKYTAFGQTYNFSEILRSPDIFQKYKANVPHFDYNKMLDKWWERTRNGEASVAWPGKTKYFALTSGTSDAASKTVPITSDMIRAIQRTSISQIRTLKFFNLPASFYEKSVLMVGGSIALTKVGSRLEGDLSGILAGRLPVWFQSYYKPGRKIAKMRDWQAKLDHIVLNANKWDIGIVAGVPAWVQILLEKIIKHYNLNSIHDIWPNFRLFIHGGVSFAPYRNSFKKLLGREIFYLETYLASEGFIAFRHADENAMQLVLNNGIFYEFVPFTEDNFDCEGNLLNNPETLTIDKVKENVDYALLISTCAGAWRYLIGDTIKFTSIKDQEIIISGRTKHYISLCGEHLSVDNMNKAIKTVSDEMGLIVNEYSVAGIPFDNMFAHQWYVGCDTRFDEKDFSMKLDEELKKINDDYGVERKEALKAVFVKRIPVNYFYDWLKSIGREGGQNKFPRVLKNQSFESWKEFIEKI